MLKKDRSEALDHLAELALHNADTLMAALEYCCLHHIGAFRINSQILPLKTHPEAGYFIEDLPGYKTIMQRYKACGRYARLHDIRTSFHPDQFVLLSSPRPSVTTKSVEELIYQAEVASWVHADVLNIHGGGAYGDKPSALERVRKNIRRLPAKIRKRLTLENDDRVYTPSDLLPLCRETGVPFVYDVHHHRCLPDGMDVRTVTEQALSTWKREPLFHLSSPKGGWKDTHPQWHHDYIDPKDFPGVWRTLDITVDVEAKAKEKAVQRLYRDLKAKRAKVWSVQT
jgi:UV DNA damage endonuclease